MLKKLLSSYARAPVMGAAFGLLLVLGSIIISAHGFLIFFSFVGGLFTDMRIYSFPNSGGWYDFGYLIGAATFLGGCGASS